MKNLLSGYSAVIITGASSGIGESFLDSIVKLDQNIFICNLSRRKQKIIISEERFRHIACDLSKADNIKSAFFEVCKILEEKKLEGPLLLINNSGFGDYCAFQDAEVQKQLDMIAVNISAVVHWIGLFLPGMVKRYCLLALKYR